MLVVRMTLIVASVLGIFLQEPDRGRYGLEIMRELELASGTLYPVLARMEAEGWLKSRREATDPGKAGRPRRRYYVLTELGKAAGSMQLATARDRIQPTPSQDPRIQRPFVLQGGFT